MCRRWRFHRRMLDRRMLRRWSWRRLHFMSHSACGRRYRSDGFGRLGGQLLIVVGIRVPWIVTVVVPIVRGSRRSHGFLIFREFLVVLGMQSAILLIYPPGKEDA